MNPLISIIVPVYNAEKYLRRCVESILEQTYQNIEVILINDGSPDGCGVICDEFAESDSRVRIVHKANSGVSDCRNIGMEMAKGEYFGFVDSDDYINHEMYERLYKAVSSSNAELSICGLDCVDENDAFIRKCGKLHDGVICRDQAFELLCGRNEVYITPVNKLYKTSVFRDLGFPVGKRCEDEFIIHHVFGMCEKITIISDSLYYYVQHEGSFMSTVAMNRLDGPDALYDRFLFFKNRGYKRFAGFSLMLGMYVCLVMLPKAKGKDAKKRLRILLRRQAGLILRYPNLWLRAIFKIDN